MSERRRERAEQRTFVARTHGTREYLCEYWTRSNGEPCAPFIDRARSGDHAPQAHTWNTREAAERDAGAFYGRSSTGERAEVVTLFEALRDAHTYVFAHGRVGQYRFGLPTGEAHLWAIWLKPSKHDADYRQRLGSIIVPEAVAAMWRDVRHAGPFKHVEVYSDADLGDERMIVRDARPAMLGFPFLLRDVVSAVEPA